MLWNLIHDHYVSVCKLYILKQACTQIFLEGVHEYLVEEFGVI